MHERSPAEPVAVALRGGALRGGAWIAGAALSLVSIPLLVRHLGVSEFGRYVAVLSIVNIAALASDLGLGSMALREWGAREPGERAGVMQTMLGLRLALASVAAVFAIGFAVVAGYPGRQVAGAAVASAGLFAQVVGDFALVGLAGSLQFGRVAAVELTRSALGTAGIVVLVVAGAGLVPFFAAYAFAAVVAAVLAIRLARGAVTLAPLFGRDRWRPLLADTAAYAAAATVYAVYFRAVMLVISVHGPARQAGLFATAYRIVEFAAAVGGVLAASVTPVLARTAREDRERLRRAAGKAVWACVAAGAVAALALALGASPLMRLIGGSQAAGAAPVLRIEAPAVACTFAAFGMGAALLVMRRYRALLAINIAALALAVGLALALVPHHGARGAAVAALSGELLVAGGQAIALLRALRAPLPSPVRE